MKYISFIHEQFCYEILFFVFYQNIFGIGGITISFHSYQMVNFFLELMKSTIPHHFIPKYCNPVALYILFGSNYSTGINGMKTVFNSMQMVLFFGISRNKLFQTIPFQKILI